MEKKFVIALGAAFMGMLGASSLALADNSGSTPAAEPAPATEPAADAAAAPAAATTEEKKMEEAAPAAPAAEGGAAQ